MISRIGYTVRGGFADLASVLRTRQWTFRSPVILTYHRVSETIENPTGPQRYTVSPATFEKDVRRFHDRATVISLRELLDWLAGEKPVPDDAVVITFDDGYRDFVTNALPILERYDVPATVYVSTKAVEMGVSPFAFRLLDALRSSKRVDVEWRKATVESNLSSAEEIRDAYSRLYSVSKFAGPEERSRLLECIGTEVTEPAPMMRPGDVATLSESSLVTVGSHGYDHVPMAAREGTAIRADLERANRSLSEWTGTPPKHFAYPYGSHGRTARRIVGDVYESSVTTEARPIRPRDWGETHRLPRFDGADREHRPLAFDTRP
jgi:peptidoglycan/xylan/chitin deacetylase (PgdA/CDA1 family)